MLVVAVLAVVTGVAVTGPILSSPAALTERPASAKDPIERHRNWTFQDAGWVDIAINVTPELDPEDVHIEVTAWHGPKPPDVSWIWACWQASNATPKTFRNSGTMIAGCGGGFTGDNYWTYGAQSGRHRVDVKRRSPYCQRVANCSSAPEEPYHVTTDQIEHAGFYDEFRNESADSVLHWTILLGAYPADRVTIEATYRNTTVSVARGPGSDVFVYQREDFDARLGAWTEYHSYRDNATLTTRLEPGSGPRFFVYDAARLWGQGHHVGRASFWYIRPDGQRRTNWAGPALLEISEQDGRWTFGFDDAYGETTEYPVLRGARFEWAELDG